MMPNFEFNVWCAYWFFTGITIGSTIMYLLNRNTIKKLRFQSMRFVDMITDLAVKNLTLNRISKQLVTINKKILSKKG